MSNTRPRISLVGALIGALVCAFGRAGVVLINIGEAGTVAVLVSLASAAIGLLIGAIAGAFAKPVKGALIGALLSGIIFELFMLPCAHLFGTVGDVFGNQDVGRDFLASTWPYFLEMAAAGAIAGTIGGLVGMRQNESQMALESKGDREITG
jgi:hypothetical protein